MYRNKLSGNISFFAIIVMMVFGLFLGGCANTMTTTTTNPDGSITETKQPSSPFGPSDYDKYAGMHNDLQKYRVQLMEGCNARMSAQPSDIEVVASRMSEQSCKMQVAMIKFDVNAPETWVGVAKHMLSQTPISLAIIEGASVAKTAIKKAGSTFGDGATVNDSLNHTEANPVTLGTSNTITPSAQGTAPAQVVKPEVVIVEPSYPPETGVSEPVVEAAAQ